MCSSVVMDSGEREMAADGSSSSSSIVFRHFDSVPLAEDHYFIKSKASTTGKDNKLIMKEWRILENNLPDSIYVQVYETRIDLLRAVIIGSAGTPYQHGLFFFDIFLPQDYPNNPPLVYYRSHGYRLNPNLYASGRLCLSLINTWNGNTEERWTKGSTILQLLVSIQGLVLNSRPYFNEPGLASHGGSKHSYWINAANHYNGGAFIRSCKIMHKIVQHPPQNFEAFVEEHFRQRAASLLAAIDHYQRGFVPVGQLGMTAASSSSSNIRLSSKTRAELKRTRALLESVFSPFCPGITITTKKELKKGILKKITSFVKKIFKSDRSRLVD